MAEENTNDVRQRKLNIKAIIGEIIIFLLFGVMLYFYYKSKDKNILVSAIVLFIHLQIILLGLLYTYYYEIKNNSKVDNYHFNKKGGNVGLFFICMFLILTCLFMYIKSMSYIIYMLVTYIILYVYITSYINYIV
jgi:L-asparagine transporter-like permease